MTSTKIPDGVQASLKYCQVSYDRSVITIARSLFTSIAYMKNLCIVISIYEKVPVCCLYWDWLAYLCWVSLFSVISLLLELFWEKTTQIDKTNRPLKYRIVIPRYFEFIWLYMIIVVQADTKRHKTKQHDI